MLTDKQSPNNNSEEYVSEDEIENDYAEYYEEYDVIITKNKACGGKATNTCLNKNIRKHNTNVHNATVEKIQIIQPINDVDKVINIFNAHVGLHTDTKPSKYKEERTKDYFTKLDEIEEMNREP